MGRSNINCYQFAQNTGRFIVTENSGLLPKCHTNYYIFNVGKSKVLVEGWYGTALGWIDVLDGVILEPGNGYTVVVNDKPYFVTGIKITNKGNFRALVHCSKVTGYPLWVEGSDIITPDINQMAEPLLEFGVTKISKINANLESIINYFWPNAVESVWDKIYKQISSLLHQKAQTDIRKLLMEDLLRLKENMLVLQSQIKTYQPSVVKAAHYMQIVNKLTFLEMKFAAYPDTNPEYINISFYLLPLYTAMVNFKILLHQFGIQFAKLVGLTYEQMSYLLTVSDKLINNIQLGAISHVKTTFKRKFDKEYQECNPELIFNTLATVRTWCSIAGFEFFSYWKSIVENKNYNYNDVITFSTYFGRPSPYLSYQMVNDEVVQPLQPRLINQKRCDIKGINVYIWKTPSGQGDPMIGGLNIVYENGDTVDTGKPTGMSYYVNFERRYLTELVAWGGDAINCLDFSFSDGTIASFGTKARAQGSRTFKLKNHKIVGFYMATDVPRLNGQAANIAVSFQCLVNP